MKGPLGIVDIGRLRGELSRASREAAASAIAFGIAGVVRSIVMERLKGWKIFQEG